MFETVKVQQCKKVEAVQEEFEANRIKLKRIEEEYKKSENAIGTLKEEARKKSIHNQEMNEHCQSLKESVIHQERTCREHSNELKKKDQVIRKQEEELNAEKVKIEALQLSIEFYVNQNTTLKNTYRVVDNELEKEN